MGALSFTAYTDARTPFEPLAVPTRHVSATNAYRHPLGHDEAAFCAALLAEVEDVLQFEGPDSVAMLIAEPVQNSGGCFTPPAGYWPGLRALCDNTASCSSPTRSSPASAASATGSPRSATASSPT